MNKFTCRWLNELLREELTRGNAIDAEETGWSKMDLVVRLQKPINSGRVEEILAQAGGKVRSFYYQNPRTGEEFGVVSCRESLV